MKKIFFLILIFTNVFLYSNYNLFNITGIAPTSVSPITYNENYYSKLQLNHSIGGFYSSSGNSFSWINSKGSYIHSENLHFNVNLSLINDLNNIGDNYLMTSGTMIYRPNQKMTLTFGFQAPGIMIHTGKNNNSSLW